MHTRKRLLRGRLLLSDRLRVHNLHAVLPVIKQLADIRAVVYPKPCHHRPTGILHSCDYALHHVRVQLHGCAFLVDVNDDKYRMIESRQVTAA